MTFYSNVKQKSYVLNPRGKPLYEDGNRFGTKMLEKMGWSKGKGLGMKEDGEQNFIRISHKIDQKGMGYQDRDDQWTGHENQFNSLLKSLDNTANVSEEEIANEAKPSFGLGFDSGSAEKMDKKSKTIKLGLSGKSLEEMSKKSSVRVHYRKFTRGKDISKYSEKDLANIFGKKSVDSNKIEPEIEKSESEADSPELIYGITTIETGTTIQDYFKKKKNETSKRIKEKSDESNEDQELATEQPEKKRKKKEKQSKEEETVAEDIQTICVDDSPRVKKEKKKKKSEKEAVEAESINISDENSDCEIVAIKMKKKKKKKSKKTSEGSQTECTELPETDKITANDECSNSIVNDSVDKVPKKKKRDKKNSINIATSNPEVNPNESVPISTEFINGILTSIVDNNNYGHSSTALEQSNANDDDDDDDDDVDDKEEETVVVNKVNPNITMNEVFEINRYHAEMFRFVDLEGFPSANLSDLSGYGYNREFELKISEKSKDQNKINDLWDYALINKYGKEVIQAKKTKRYSIKHLKKKNVFMKV